MGMSEIIGTPVFHKQRIYVATGRDPNMAEDEARCTASTPPRRRHHQDRQGLDLSGPGPNVVHRLNCRGPGLYFGCRRAAALPQCGDGTMLWVHETGSEVWGSTLVADGKVYMPTPKGLWVLAAGKEKKVLSRINVGGAARRSPVAANGTLYFAAKTGWMWAVHSDLPWRGLGAGKLARSAAIRFDLCVDPPMLGSLRVSRAISFWPTYSARETTWASYQVP